MDLRGHGDSTWSTDGCYGYDVPAGDVADVLALAGPAAVVGAYLGGLAALLCADAYPNAGLRALVLVDVVPNVEAAGAAAVFDFMAARPGRLRRIHPAGAALLGLGRG